MKGLDLDSLNNRIANKDCPKCPRMNGCNPVFSMTELDINKNIMFIAEAPGRLGAELSRIPMKGDQSGENFEELISAINLSRDSFFITNAVLCLPLTKTGKNDAPKESEINNCSKFLSEQIELVNPEIIITLGKSALNALKKIRNHNFTLSKNVGSICLWNGYVLFPLYHTSPKVFNMHRNKNQQLQDYQKLGDWLERNKLIE